MGLGDECCSLRCFFAHKNWGFNHVQMEFLVQPPTQHGLPKGTGNSPVFWPEARCIERARAPRMADTWMLFVTL